MAKQKQPTINNCIDCTNSFRITSDNCIYCSTKVRDRDKLTDSAKVGTATDCAYFRDKNKMRVWK